MTFVYEQCILQPCCDHFLVPGLLSMLLGYDIGDWSSHVVLVVKKPPANTRDMKDVDLIPRSGKSPGGGHGNTL